LRPPLIYPRCWLENRFCARRLDRTAITGPLESKLPTGRRKHREELADPNRQAFHAFLRRRELAGLSAIITGTIKPADDPVILAR